MDDEVAELARLRRRAYGPDADIHDDPVGLARLIELEERAHRGADALHVEHPPAAAGAEPAPTLAPTHRRPRLVALAVAAAVAVALLGAQTPGPVRAADTAVVGAPLDDGSLMAAASADPGGVLVRVPLTAPRARYVPQGPPPVFPVDSDLRWAESLGPYYGWELWLARSASGSPCLLLVRGEADRGQCIPQARFLEGLLSVSLPIEDVPAEYRPAQMTADQSIVYRWMPRRGVTVELADRTAAYLGGAASPVETLAAAGGGLDDARVLARIPLDTGSSGSTAVGTYFGWDVSVSPSPAAGDATCVTLESGSDVRRACADRGDPVGALVSLSPEDLLATERPSDLADGEIVGFRLLPGGWLYLVVGTPPDAAPCERRAPDQSRKMSGNSLSSGVPGTAA